MKWGYPTAADYARSLVAGHLMAEVSIPWGDGPTATPHRAREDGSLVLTVDSGHPLQRAAAAHGSVAASVRFVDVSAVGGFDRVRGEVALGGYVRPSVAGYTNRGLHQGWLLNFDVERIAVRRRDSSCSVDLLAYQLPNPDPLADQAHRIVAHTNQAHPELVRALANQLGVPYRQAELENITCHGFSLNLDDRSAWLGFAQRVSGWQEVRENLRSLTHCCTSKERLGTADTIPPDS